MRQGLYPILFSRGRFDLYVDSVTGSDNNGGKTTASAFATLAAATTVAKPGQRIGLARGSTWREQLTVPCDRLTFAPYGGGAKPIINGASQLSSGSWTNVTGTEYKISAGGLHQPNTGGPTPAITWIDAGGTKTSIFKGTAGALTANQYVIASNELSVNIGRLPIATDLFEVGQRYCVAVEKSNVTINGLDLRYAEIYGVACNLSAALSNLEVSDCEISWCAADGMNVNLGTGTGILFLRNYVHDQPSDGGGGGDGFSGHGASSGLVAGCTFQRCAKNGFNASELGSWDVYNNTFDGADCIFFGGGGPVGGPHRAWRNRLYNEKPGGNASQPILYFQVANAATVGEFYNNSLSRGTGTSNMRGIRQDGGVLTARNNTVWGTGPGAQMSFGLMKAGGTLTESNNAVGGCGADLSGWPSPGTSRVALVGNPYTDSTTGDLSPGVASPLLAAGIAVAGITTGTPPDVGYTGAA